MGYICALSAYLDREQISKSLIYSSYMGVLVFYYVMYLSCSHIWTLMAFNNTISGSFNDAYFFYINMIEMVSFIFVRTRSSIKYFPKLITIANIIFLFYVNSEMYPCQFESLNLLQNFSVLLIFFFLNNFEYEAVNNWNPFGNWTPSEINPRCAYHHIHLNSNYNIGFEMFSMA